VTTFQARTLTWDGITIGGPDSDVHFGEGGVEGLGQPAFDSQPVPRALGGSFGGVDRVLDRTISAEAWIDCPDGEDPSSLDFTTLMALHESMRVRPQPDDELPLVWSEMMWPGDWCAFARPRRCEWLTDEDGVHNGAPGVDLQWVASDAAAYSADYEQRLWPTDDPVGSDEFQVPNTGYIVEHARRAWDLRLTAHGSVVNPFVRVDHADGTFEKVVFPVSMTGGQVLTVGADLRPRVGQQIVSSVRSTTEVGVTSKVPRWWLLHHSTGDDEANVVTVDHAGSGTFSGWMRTRSTR
jgi:hypothetical protein